MQCFSFSERQKNLKRLAEEKFDLLIIGGGITGAGVARDAASRGLKVALVEARDFAVGTSSRSSKLVHGGVRYLENFEFGLVFEALSERALLFKMAPHLVHPLRFLIPIYKSSRVSFWKMRLGMWLYDILALFETPQMHEALTQNEVIERIPTINARELSGAVEYSDAYMDDDRLVIETLRDAHRMGAVIVNYARVEGAESTSIAVGSLKIKDEWDNKTFSVRADQYLSGVGPWTDIFAEQVFSDWQKKLRPTKGVHLIFSRKKIPISRAVVMAVEKRIIFVIPRHEMVIVGTTDTDYKGDPAAVNVELEDVDYLLRALNTYFPNLEIDYTDIISSYSGVRPLVDDGSSSEGKTSREHSIWSHNENLTFVAGGKYTTYRLISEEAVDHVLEKVPFDKAMAFKNSDTKKPLNPYLSPSTYERSLFQAPQWAEKYAMNLDLVTLLIERHGPEALTLLELIKQKYINRPGNEALWMAEAEFAIKQTMCLTLVDFYWRRAPLFLAMKDHGIKYLDAISEVFADELNLSDEQIAKQKEDLRKQMQFELSWRSQTIEN